MRHARTPDAAPFQRRRVKFLLQYGGDDALCDGCTWGCLLPLCWGLPQATALIAKREHVERTVPPNVFGVVRSAYAPTEIRHFVQFALQVLRE